MGRQEPVVTRRNWASAGQGSGPDPVGRDLLDAHGNHAPGDFRRSGGPVSSREMGDIQSQGDDAVLDDLAVGEAQRPHRREGGAPALRGRSWIEQPLTLGPGLVDWEVAVTEDDEPGVREAAAEPERPTGAGPTVVDEGCPDAVELARALLGEHASELMVVVAAHGERLDALGQFREHGRAHDVARMEQEVGGIEGPQERRRKVLRCFGPQVGVSEDGNDHV